MSTFGMNCSEPDVNFGDPRRRQGICLRTNPVIHERIDAHFPPKNEVGANNQASTSLGSRSNLEGCTQSLGGRSSCEFITFKGLPITPANQIQNNFEITAALSISQQDNSRSSAYYDLTGVNLESKPAPAHDDFHTVPLENFTGKKGTFAMDELPTVKSHNNEDSNGTSAETDQQLDVPPFKFAGILGTIASVFFFSFTVLCIKLIPDGDSIQERTKQVCFRGIFLALFCSIAIIREKSNFKVPREEILLTLIRSGVSFFSSYGAYLALQYITVGESSALIYSSPIWTILLSRFLLNEQLPLSLILVLPLGVFGILMIAHPDLILGMLIVGEEVLTEVDGHQMAIKFNGSIAIGLHHTNGTMYAFSQDLTLLTHAGEAAQAMSYNTPSELDLLTDIDRNLATEFYLQHRWPGILIAIATSFVTSIVFMTLKFRNKTPIQTATFYLGVGTIIMSTIIQCFIGFGRFPDTWLEWGLLVLVGVSSWIGQYLFQWSLLYERANVLSVVRTLEVAMSLTWSATFLDEDLLWTSVVGAAVIILAVSIVMFNDTIERLFCSRCRNSL